MNEPFVPLHAAGTDCSGRSEFHVTLVNPAENPRPFQPLGRAPAGDPAGKCEPRLTLQRDGDRVLAIRIECTCGQTLELACVYGSEKS